MFEDTADAVDEMNGLGDIGAALGDFERADLGNPQVRKLKFAQFRSLIAKQIGRRQTRTGIKAGETKGLVATPRTLYSSRQLGTAIAANGELKFFHKGIDDGVDELGWDAAPASETGDLTYRYTNMQRDGRLPSGELFVVHGISCELPDSIPIADYRQLIEGTVRWEENQGSTCIQLGQVREMVSVYHPDMEFTGGDTTSGGVRTNVRMAGPKFVFKRPLFVIRGSIARSDSPVLVVKYWKAVSSLTNGAEMRFRLHGTWFQKLSGAR